MMVIVVIYSLIGKQCIVMELQGNENMELMLSYLLLLIYVMICS